MIACGMVRRNGTRAVGAGRMIDMRFADRGLLVCPDWLDGLMATA